MIPFIEAERKEDLERIKTFCRERDADGGMLMVCGPRGSGKTRLVDEALAEDHSKHWWNGHLRRLLGDNHKRCQPRACRPPRELERILFKVEVDPFFPLPGTNKDHDNRKGCSDPSPRKDPNALAFQLLRNLVFALTSLLDPRPSQRRYGRTLRARLGFWRYWFDPTSLCLSMNKPFHAYLIGIFFIVLALLLTLVTGGDWGSFGIFFLSSLVTLPPAWAFLRWLDWRALSRFSSHLYDLVHAQDMDQTTQQTKELKLQGNHRWALPASLGLGAGMIFTALGINLFPITFPTETGAGLIGAGLLLLGTGGLAASWLGLHKESQISHFGQNNPVWMITQLRRYLFLLHRTGIEPVLVFDELDKLEPKVLTTGERQTHDLDDFLTAIQRLRQILSGDFITLLVGAEGLAAAYEKALAPSFPQPLGSMIQETVYLGPISPTSVQEWCKRDEKKIQKGSSLKQDEALAWVFSNGLYARLQGYQQDSTINQQDPEKITGIVVEVNNLWSAEALIREVANGDRKPWMQAFIHPRTLTLIHGGMACLVADLANGNSPRNDFEGLGPKDIQDHLRTQDPEKRMAVGRHILDRRLREKKLIDPPRDL
ncbi:MAG: hypothetical protein DIZ78_07725 [endosymbiont of Escarpia spicata]|uniref:Uncharacterized protein n=1 Tax=endosymbiont of Escarpia spicata TaxID=2200908 RepID=A0A370DPC3_9GAMM|nr:MAG: hypothetical protein DIZ78_07725 [endosymbiont of Escarpia spicata]